MRVSSDIYLAMDAFIQTLSSVDEAHFFRENQSLAEKARIDEANCKATFERTKKEIVEMGGDPASIEQLTVVSESIFDIKKVMDQPGDTEEERKILRIKSIQLMGRTLTLFNQQLKYVRRMLSTPPEKPLFGIPPLQLLQLAALVNIFYLLLVVAFVERSISSPLDLLTKACEKIRQRLPVEKPKILRSEIGTLQESFQYMAAQVVENEIRRKSYVNLLQTVQLSTLSKSRARLHDLMQSEELQDKAKGKLQKTIESLRTLESLLHSMSEQLENSASLLNPETAICSSQQLLSSAKSAVEALLQNRRIHLAIENEDFAFEADKNLILRVILNLLSNAIKYSPDRGKIAIEVEADEEMLRFSIKDSGAGISEAEQKKLFRRFAQVEALDGKQRAGTGLGLVICKELVEAHNGKIGCTSNPGSGSTFWFTLPRKKHPGSSNAVNAPAAESRLEKSLPAQTRLQKFEKKTIKSTKASFILLLGLFIAIQAYLFTQLNALFLDSAMQASSFSSQKQNLFLTQELYVSFVRWANRLRLAAVKFEITAAQVLLPELGKQRKELSRISGRFKKNSNSFKLLSKIHSDEGALLKLLYKAKSNVSEVMSDINSFQEQASKEVAKVERSWRKMLREQNDAIQSSYDFSRKLSGKINSVLIVAAIADTLLILAASFVGLKLAGKILILKSKAETFAAGKEIESSLSGNDELSFLDQRLCQVAGELKEAESKRQELIAVINHDLRTPLASILGTLESLNLGVYGNLNGTDSKLATESKNDLMQLMDQINDLLMLEKIESGTYKLTNEMVDVQELLTEVKTGIEIAAEKKRLQVDLNKNTENNVRFLTDRQLLKRILSIALKNAVEASPENARVEVSISACKKELTIDFANRGIAIKELLLPQIFERFRFIDNKPLTGFGLPLAYQAAKEINAELSFIENSEQKIVLRISIPLRSQTESTVSSKESSSPDGNFETR